MEHLPLTTDRTKAELINEFFTRRTQKSAGEGDTISGVGSIPPDLATNSQLSNFTVDEHSVRKALHGLNETKAPGGDGIPTRLLRLTADEIALCITYLFNTSLSTGKLPSEWKEAQVTPIFKSRGSRQLATNYRPISFLSHPVQTSQSQSSPTT